MPLNTSERAPCLVVPPPQLYSATFQLANIADALDAHDATAVRDGLHSVDLAACRKYWTDCGKQWGLRHRKADHIGRERTKRVTVSRTTRLAIGDRDGWRCRYCALPLAWAGLCKGVLDALVADVGDDANDLWRVFSQSPDHVVPVGAGGPNSPENLVSSCGPCNFGKVACLIEELGLEDPRGREPIRDGWTGLVGRPREAFRPRPL
ncbi:MAG: HNH endonuclease [Actinomycetota bacterium]|nr:HNH endonuclease [Actinomycetota bacterium]